ncbi:uncharacterized protein LOC105201065 isoform X4 [Solenopsis invicta]|uniref:uncharacterized protein LOC105201065 isoform X4 n=1 Tax=Solenopsis invicta TaxID=13686 RepID=UPI00193E65FF|nr:uncharacterized protein LOC105201065 isoform X4 [Solenopsis invicta]
MSMTMFALLGLVLSLIKISSEWQLTKCCPPGQILVNNFTNCESVPIFAIEVYYWNITREFQGIPQCDESEDLVTTALDDFESDTVLEVPACLELFYIKLKKKPIKIIRYCRSNKDQQVKAIDTSIPQLLHIRKCCFGDTIFDSGTKTCVTRLNESQSLGAFLLNRSTDAESAVIVTQGPPECKGPIVNYEINENDIFLRNSTYLVMIPVSKNNVKEEPVTEDNACLEMTPEFAVERKVVVRICRDPEFCDTNACIRKCCSEDKYAYEGCINFLRFKPNEVGEFYNAFVNAVDQTNSFTFDTTKDHGVLIQQPCDQMYTYDPKEWEKQVLLTSNGHVFIRHYDANDMHCFDVRHNYFDNSTNFDLFVCGKYVTPETYKRTVRENMNVKDRKNRKRLLLYCLYGWGIPLLLLIIIIVVDNTNLLPEYLAPNIGNMFCSITYTASWDNYSDLIFLYGPETIVTISNVVFFILTLKYYNKVKADIKDLNTDPRSNQLDSIKDRFIMIVKLFIVMGMQWTFETVDYFLEKYSIVDKWNVFFYISLVLDCLEGLLIFIIFVLKKSVYQAIRKRLQDIKKNQPAT